MPRVAALVLLLLSLTMLVPLVPAVVRLAQGAEIPPDAWRLPLLVLATGAMLLWLLSKKQLPLQLFAVAFALWILAAGYYWMTRFWQ